MMKSRLDNSPAEPVDLATAITSSLESSLSVES